MSEVTSQVSSLGANLLTVSINSDKSLKLDDTEKLGQLTGIESVAPYVNVSAAVAKGSTKEGMVSVVGVDQNYMDIRNYSLGDGRKIPFVDVDNKSKVCVIGSGISEDLFQAENPVGGTVKIAGDNYTVVSVLESQGPPWARTRTHSSYSDHDLKIYLGKRQHQRVHSGIDA